MTGDIISVHKGKKKTQETNDGLNVKNKVGVIIEEQKGRLKGKIVISSDVHHVQRDDWEYITLSSDSER